MATPRTPWLQLEPPGLGTQPFGDIGPDDPGYDGPIQIHGRGFGDDKTIWTEASNT